MYISDDILAEYFLELGMFQTIVVEKIKILISFLIVVFPCMLTIIQLLFQQNAHVFYY
jgi:hypothetical protein